MTIRIKDPGSAFTHFIGMMMAVFASTPLLIKASRQSYKEYKTDLTTLITMEESYRMISVNYTYALANYYNAWNAFIREVNNEKFTVNEVENI